jgi:archaellum component FlaC
MENVITEISKALAAEVKGDYKELQKQLKKISKTINTDIKNNYQELQEQIQEVREQNNKLVELLEKQNRSLPEKLKEIFKSK